MPKVPSCLNTFSHAWNFPSQLSLLGLPRTPPPPGRLLISLQNAAQIHVLWKAFLDSTSPHFKEELPSAYLADFPRLNAVFVVLSLSTVAINVHT